MNSNVRYLPAIGRLLTAAIFIVSGLGKIAAPAMTLAYIASAALPIPTLAYLIAIVIEVIGGFFLIIGFHSGNRRRAGCLRRGDGAKLSS